VASILSTSESTWGRALELTWGRADLRYHVLPTFGHTDCISEGVSRVSQTLRNIHWHQPTAKSGVKVQVSRRRRLLGWGLMALLAQIGHIVPYRKLKFVEDVYL